jgi:predicted nuclease of restriction endonuclease-like (RecB) superfamily
MIKSTDQFAPYSIVMKGYPIENMQDLRALYLNYAFEVNYIQCLILFHAYCPILKSQL